ncbi:MAG: Trk system potassium transporter TrkA [Oscillospiraceae bacterium]|nr:Trk system potassium transporter TrkA [Oscillospiraceae bacterium]
MNIIIAGHGRFGATLTRLLSAEGHDLTIIDCDSQLLEATQEQFDVIAVHGNCAAMDTLLHAGVKDADLLIAVTNADEVNLLCCTTAHGLNPKLHTIARIRNPEYTQQMFTLQHIFGLSMAINPEKQVATEIKHLLEYPGFLKRDSFAKGRTEIVELRVDSSSKLKDIALFDLNPIVKCRVLVCAVIRGGQAIAPKGNFILREGDRIFVTAPTQNLTTLLRNLGIITRRVRRVVLCGGGRVSFYLASMLEKAGISVLLVEQDPDRCQELAAQLPNTVIIHGDSSDQTLLDSEGLADADAMVSLTGQDEQNMIMSLYGQSRGIPQVITKLNRVENRRIIDALGLGSVVCPKELSCNTIARYVRAMDNQSGAAVSVHAIADGQAEAVEFQADSRTRNCGIPLKEIKLKSDVLLVSITQGSQTEIPSGDSRFYPGDTVVVVTSDRGSIRQLNDIFA